MDCREQGATTATAGVFFECRAIVAKPTIQAHIPDAGLFLETSAARLGTKASTTASVA